MDKLPIIALRPCIGMYIPFLCNTVCIYGRKSSFFFHRDLLPRTPVAHGYYSDFSEPSVRAFRQGPDHAAQDQQAHVGAHPRRVHGSAMRAFHGFGTRQVHQGQPGDLVVSRERRNELKGTL